MVWDDTYPETLAQVVTGPAVQWLLLQTVSCCHLTWKRKGCLHSRTTAILIRYE